MPRVLTKKELDYLQKNAGTLTTHEMQAVLKIKRTTLLDIIREYKLPKMPRGQKPTLLGDDKLRQFQFYVRQGLSIPRIARIMGITSNTLRTAIRRWETPESLMNPPAKLRAEWAKLFRQGVSKPEIARQYHVTRASITKGLRPQKPIEPKRNTVIKATRVKATKVKVKIKTKPKGRFDRRPKAKVKVPKR